MHMKTSIQNLNHLVNIFANPQTNCRRRLSAFHRTTTSSTTKNTNNNTNIKSTHHHRNSNNNVTKDKNGTTATIIDSQLKQQKTVVESFSTGGTARGIIETPPHVHARPRQQPVAASRVAAAAAFGILTVSGCFVALSLYIRERREEELEHVPLASLSGAFYVATMKKKKSGNDDGHGDEESLNGGGGGKLKRELRELKTLVMRIGLMNGHPSVKILNISDHGTEKEVITEDSFYVN